MKRIISLGIIFLLAIIVLWSITTDYKTSDQLLQVKSKQFAEVFMNEFEMTAMDESGKPDYILNGAYLQRNKNSQDTEIRQPVLQLLSSNKQWKVSADRAVLNNRSETVRLISNVVMQQQNIEPAITIRTQNLLINAGTSIAQTRANVDLTRGKSHIQSKGMVYNHNTSELELSSNVNGHYLPYD
jgi:LPS export ABC transporter protein LptC